MMGAKGWGDLTPRLGSALVLASIAGLALWVGGLLFAGLIIIIIAAMVWELGSMLTAGSKRKIWITTGIAAFTIIATSVWDVLWVSITLLLISSVLQRMFFVRHKNIGALFSFAIMSAGTVLFDLRQDFGLPIILWLICLVMDGVALIIFVSVVGAVIMRKIGQNYIKKLQK